MMPRVSTVFFASLILLLALGSCQRSQTNLPLAQPQWLRNDQARGFRLGAQGDDQFLLLLDPVSGDTLGRFQWGPGQYAQFRHLDAKSRIASGSGVISGLFSALDLDTLIRAVDQRSYQPHGLMHREDLIQFALGGNFNRQELLKAQPHLLVHYFFDNSQREEIERLAPKVPVLWIQNYREASPLAKAEWIRAVGFLFGAYSQADSLYSLVKHNYQKLAQQAKVPKPVFCNLPYAGNWTFPGQNAYLSTLIRDAGGTAIWPQESQSEVMVMGIEEAVGLWNSQPQLLWIHPGDCPDWDCMADRVPRLMPLSRQTQLRVAQCDKGDLPGQVNRWYNEGSVRPDQLLSDLIHLTQDSLPQPDSLYFYRLIKQP